MFGIDCFHLVSGIGLFMVELLTVNPEKRDPGNNSCYKHISEQYPSQYPFLIPSSYIQEISQLVEQSKLTLPTSFESTFCDPITGKSNGFRGIEWIETILHIIPNLFVPRLKHEKTKQPVLSLCKAITLIMQWELNGNDLRQVER
ncbi:hypothetical protein [Parasitella parasitica]|uniref:Uncharacterized protein n=1 Tax=Parasitella parasitica TaxID=35722 RepID=A0A0B7N8R5_9FUNG|nr:hypothetical protein [Parasitella parasitica]